MDETKSFTPADSVMPQEKIDQDPGHTLKTQCADNHQSESFCLSEGGTPNFCNTAAIWTPTHQQLIWTAPEKQNCLKAPRFPDNMSSS